MCAHNSIGVRECFRRRGVLEEINCPLCNRDTKLVLHAFYDCEKIKPVWIQLGTKWTDPYFLTKDLQDWLESNGKVVECLLPRNPPWKLIFILVIWKNGNQVVIKGKSRNPGLATKIKIRAVEYLFCASSPRSANRLVMR